MDRWTHGQRVRDWLTQLETGTPNSSVSWWAAHPGEPMASRQSGSEGVRPRRAHVSSPKAGKQPLQGGPVRVAVWLNQATNAYAHFTQTPADTPRTMCDQLSGHLVTQSSRHIEWTITPPTANKASGVHAQPLSALPSPNPSNQLSNWILVLATCLLLYLCVSSLYLQNRLSTGHAVVHPSRFTCLKLEYFELTGFLEYIMPQG